MTDQLNDVLDREIRAYLAWRTERVGGAPSPTEMVGLVAGRGPTSLRSMWPGYRVRWAVAAALLSIALVGALVFGGGFGPFEPDATVRPDATPEPTGPRAAGVEPINGWIAYPTRAHDAMNGVPGEIFLTLPGQTAVRVAGGRGETICPSFSPDGTKLSYVEGDDVVFAGGDPATGMTEVYRAVDVGRTAGACQVWSPSSQAVALLARDGIAIHGPGLDRMIAAAAPWAAEEFMFANYNPLAWSPDGSTIAYAARDGIWLVNPDGSNSRRISEANAWSIGWSSDGTRLVYVTTRSVGQDRAIREVNVLTVSAPAEVFVLGEGSKPVWARSGDTIAFSSPDGLVTIEADGSNRRVVIAAVGYGFGGWSPKGDYLLYMVDMSGHSFELLAVSTIDGSFVSITPTDVQTGSSRNFPDMGDVSWQAIYP